MTTEEQPSAGVFLFPDQTWNEKGFPKTQPRREKLQEEPQWDPTGEHASCKHQGKASFPSPPPNSPPRCPFAVSSLFFNAAKAAGKHALLGN